jgi:sterol desaturase/sphingolipid hydroxylase (fatty acid hydroxylase superfamily)
VHKIHHRHINTVFLASASAHPLEYVFGNCLPSTVGVLILGRKMHFVTVIGWFFARNFETLEGHSGYEFSWSPFRWIPLSTGHGYHAYHHSANVGNFSSFFHVWDTVMGSNRSYKEYMKENKTVKTN